MSNASAGAGCRYAIAWMGLACCALAAARAGADDALRRRALVVGVQDYAAVAAAEGLANLRYPDADAEGLAAVLGEAGYRVAVMTRPRSRDDDALRPTADRILHQLDLILADPSLGESGVVLVAFSGHGLQAEVARDGKPTREFCFVPLDGRPSRPDTLVSIDEVYRRLEACRAGTKLVLADACRNDPQHKAASATMPRLPAPPGGTLAYFACSSGEFANEDAALGHGVFFHYVIEGLKGGAAADRRGNVGATALAAYVGPRVYDHVLDTFKSKQVPELKGSDRLSVVVSRGVGAAATDGKSQGVPVTNAKPKQSVVTGATTKPAAGNESITNSIGGSLVRIGPGAFTMGSPLDEAGRTDGERLHKVTLTKAFYMGTTPVTQKQWRAIMDTSPSHFVGDNLPVEQVSWNDAAEFCRKLSRREGKVYRLPTEAEWEYACRAGTKTVYYTGNDEAALAVAGWYKNDSDSKTHPVGEKKANAWGLFDMHGNVQQWCADGFDYYDWGDATDPTGAKADLAKNYRVVRGGACYYEASLCRAASRGQYSPDFRYNHAVGFRVAMNVP